MKVTLIGSPGDIFRFHQTVVTTVAYKPRSVMLPKGVPVPPEETFPAVLYISVRHWRKVEPSLEQQPGDQLIAEGYALWDDQLRRLSVFVQNCSTVLLERAKLEARGKHAAAAALGAPPPAPEPQPEPQPAPRPATAQPAAPPRKNRQIFAMPDGKPTALEVVSADPRFEGLPAPVVEQAQGIQLAINQFRGKLEQLEQKPADQRFGYDMTKKMLENAERQLNALLTKYKK